MPVYCSCNCWTLCNSRKGPMILGSVHPSVFRLSGCFLGIGSLDFSEFWHGASNLDKVVFDRARFFWKNFCPKNRGNRPKIGFFELKKKIWSLIFTEFVL